MNCDRLRRLSRCRKKSELASSVMPPCATLAAIRKLPAPLPPCSAPKLSPRRIALQSVICCKKENPAVASWPALISQRLPRKTAMSARSLPHSRQHRNVGRSRSPGRLRKQHVPATAFQTWGQLLVVGMDGCRHWSAPMAGEIFRCHGFFHKVLHLTALLAAKLLNWR